MPKEQELQPDPDTPLQEPANDPPLEPDPEPAAEPDAEPQPDPEPDPAPAAPPPTSAEDRARTMGWKPKEEFTGEHEWVDAETFLEQTENDPAQMKRSLRAMERNMNKMEKTLDSVHAHQQRVAETAEQQGYDRAIREAEERHAQAIEDGDVEGAHKAMTDRDNLKDRKQAAGQPKEPPEVAAWKEDNPWFGTDPVLSKAAADMTDFLAAQGASVQEQLKGAAEYVKETYPHKFPEENMPGKRRQAPRMNGNNNGVVRPQNLKMGTYEALKPETRAECDRFVKDRMLRSKSKNETEDQCRAEWLKFATEDMFVEGAK